MEEEMGVSEVKRKGDKGASCIRYKTERNQ